MICWITKPTRPILSLKKRILNRRLWPAAVWAIFILVLTGTPGEYIPRVTSFWEWLSPDKVVHVFTFALLTFLILSGSLQQYLDSQRRYLYVVVAVGFSLAYGLLTEVLQTHVWIGRHGNAYDFIADGIGAFAGWLAFVIMYGKKIKNYANTNQD